MRMIQRVCWALFALAAALTAQGNPEWHKAFPAFQIAGELYYVGTADLAVYLVQHPQGNILINSDFEQDLPLIKASIESLGFRYKDTKILLISHAHGDHDAATGVIRKETDAKLMVMDADVPGRRKHRAWPSRRSRRPHSARWRHRRTGRPETHCAFDAGSHEGLHHLDDAGSRRLANTERSHRGQPQRESRLHSCGQQEYPQIADDYVKTFAVLKSLPCDLFLGAHGAYFGLKEKYDKMKAGEPNPFIDPEGYKAYVAEREATFRKEWKRQQEHPGSPAQ